MSDDPVLVEVTRGDAVESFHRGATAVINGDGDVLFSCGDIERPIFPRSAIKPMQALPLVESGAADRLGLSDEELALCCASHGGEPRHVALAAGILAKVGLSVDALACGVQWPSHEPSARALARAGQEPTPLHNNCSGKHAGFLCLACDQGEPPAGYERAEHSVQRQVREALEGALRLSLDDAPVGIDGCSIPTYAVPLRALAAGYARLASGQGVGKQRANAGRRLLDAAMAHPDLVAGDGRFDTKFMTAFPGKVFTKTGAEGVYCAAVPGQALGIAIKIDEGAARAAEIAVAALLARFAGIDAAKAAPFSRRTLRNWRGIVVGEIRPAGPLALQKPRADA